ncbi:MAG: HlyC/CorC family transporter [Spirochaetales bacterium]|nr:HlyC/CorC family transporter [Spirochaetales bacterium]
MMRGVVELSDTTVKEIMVPRIDVVFLSINTPWEQLLETLCDSGHSRLPIYENTIDNVVGFLYAKDILRFLVEGKEDRDISKIIRKPYFVPESMKLNKLLRELKRRRVHIAIVVDEYGGTSGIVCLEDIIEEIVGDIQDEFDNETEEIIKIGEGVYLCDTRMNLEDLNEMLNLSLNDEESDTLGGFVFGLFGKIPVKFEKVSYENIDFVVQDMEGHKIESIKLIINQKRSDDENQGESR